MDEEPIMEAAKVHLTWNIQQEEFVRSICGSFALEAIQYKGLHR